MKKIIIITLFTIGFNTILQAQERKQWDNNLTIGYKYTFVGFLSITGSQGGYIELDTKVANWFSLVNRINMMYEQSYKPTNEIIKKEAFYLEYNLGTRFYIIPEYFFLDGFVGLYYINGVTNSLLNQDKQHNIGFMGGISLGGIIPITHTIGVQLAVNWQMQVDKNSKKQGSTIDYGFDLMSHLLETSIIAGITFRI